MSGDLTAAQDRSVRLALKHARERLQLHALADQLDTATATKIRAIIGPRSTTTKEDDH